MPLSHKACSSTARSSTSAHLSRDCGRVGKCNMHVGTLQLAKKESHRQRQKLSRSRSSSKLCHLWRGLRRSLCQFLGTVAMAPHLVSNDISQQMRHSELLHVQLIGCRDQGCGSGSVPEILKFDP